MSQSSNHLRLVSWTWQWVHFTQMTSTVTRSQSNRALWDVEEREIHIMDVQTTNLQQLCDAIMTIWPKSLRNVSNTLLNLCHEELRQFWRQKGVQPGTSKVYLIKWPVSVYTVSHRSEYTPHIFVNILLYIFMWPHWRNDTLLQCKVVSVQLV